MARVLIVEADAEAGANRATELARAGFEATRVGDAVAAGEVLMREQIDVIVADDRAHSQVEKLYGVHLAVVPIAGPTAALIKTLARLARKRESPTAQLALAGQIDEALAALTIGLEPIVDLQTGATIAFHARPQSPGIGQHDLIEAASQLRRGRDVGRRMRELIAQMNVNGDLFVDFHTDDLLDPLLYQGQRISGRRIACVGPRDVDIADIEERVDALRERGWALCLRMANAELAALTSVGVFRPRFVAFDVTVASGATLLRVLKNLVEICRETQTSVVAVNCSIDTELSLAKEAGCVAASGATLRVG